MTLAEAFTYAAFAGALLVFAFTLRAQRVEISRLRAVPAETVRVEVPKTIDVEAFRLRCGYVPRTPNAESDGASR